MSRVRFSPRSLTIGLALVAVVGIALTLAVVAQDPEGPEPGAIPYKITVVEEVELLPDLEAPDQFLYYKFISANTFVPYDDDMTYAYGGAGCVYRTGGTRFANHTLQLPQGAEIDYVRVFFYDNDASYDAGVYLYAYDGYGAFTEIRRVTSSGTPGQGSQGSGFFSYFVDNQAEALSLTLDYGLGGNQNVQICGVRLRYQYSIATVRLPLLLNQTNP
jgi:hypothetical protein